jgi:hypothetical protein
MITKKVKHHPDLVHTGKPVDCHQISAGSMSFSFYRFLNSILILYIVSCLKLKPKKVLCSYLMHNLVEFDSEAPGLRKGITRRCSGRTYPIPESDHIYDN